ncbi:hypothetical protein IH992_26490 [Candidatus Poribacteria bacterium]|nr:hypothetical protein [Candidatus Poribacteria bacterium]
MSDFENLLKELKKHIEDLQKTFIDAFIPTDPSTGPEAYEHQVQAYCLLCHAAFEEYFEKVALKVMSLSLNEWMTSGKYTDTLMMLVSYYGLKIEIDQDEEKAETRVFDYLRPLFEDIKKKFSTDVYNNHGISLKYLRNLLIPVAIDIKEDIGLKNSLQKLARERGEYAHKRLIKTVLAPEDARSYVNDCLDLCEDVKAKAESKFI